ncbi:MAG: general stress protein CsbD [Saprospiraceae bacterium]
MKKINELKLLVSWEEVKEKIKETNIELTDADLNYQPGQAEAFLDHLSHKMKRNRDEIRSWIESISANKGKAS